MLISCMTKHLRQKTMLNVVKVTHSVALIFKLHLRDPSKYGGPKLNFRCAKNTYLLDNDVHFQFLTGIYIIFKNVRLQPIYEREI